MNNKSTKLLIGVVLVLLLLFLGWYFMLPKNQNVLKPIDQESNKNPQNKMEEKTEELTGTMLDLLGMNKTQKCTFQASSDGMATSGVTYISGNKMRAESTVEIDSKQIQSYTISDGEWMYMWGDLELNGTKTGMKLKLADFRKESEDFQTSDNTDLGKSNPQKQLLENYKYNCDNWTNDESVFNVPTDIDFIDLNQTMNKVLDTMKGNSNGNSNQCGVCEMLQDEDSKRECLQSLNC